MEEFNLHLTGDVHAVSLAHNLCAAFIDNALKRKNRLNIDPDSIQWRRIVDVSDAALRNIVIGLGGRQFLACGGAGVLDGRHQFGRHHPALGHRRDRIRSPPVKPDHGA